MEAEVESGLDRGWIVEEEINIWSRIYFTCMCVWVYTHMYTNALCINEINMYTTKVYIGYLFLRYPQDSRLRILQ